MVKLTGIIQTFEPIFEREGITHSQEASLYYVLSICDPSLNFTETLREARKIRRTVSQRALTKGRDYLLKKGFLANVLLTHDTEKEFEQKDFIPVHLRIIFEENEEYLKEIYEPEDFSVRKKQVEDLYGVYEDNYGDYGLKMGKGCITLYYSRKWIVSYIAGIITGRRVKVGTLSMMLSGLRVFEEKYRQYYEDMIERGSKIRIVFGGEEEIEEMEEAKALRNKYEESVEVRYSPTISRTCKSFIIDDKLAMDGNKLLTTNGEELSYIGIMYLKEEDSVKNLRRDFENVWKISKALI
ncbi:MAG: hypothetical protein KAU16_08305 [Methanophagales archaeon]|nr:hypothetical protein [Methanophagales archaeon]